MSLTGNTENYLFIKSFFVCKTFQNFHFFFLYSGRESMKGVSNTVNFIQEELCTYIYITSRGKKRKERKQSPRLIISRTVTERKMDNKNK